MARVKLNPNLPLCWEDDQTLRVGFETAFARLHDPSPGTQRLLYSLLRGIEQDLLADSARAAGISRGEAEQVIAALQPALVPAPGGSEVALAEELHAQGDHRLVIAISDGGREVSGLAAAVAGTELCRLNQERGYHPPELIIYVERFLEPLDRAQRWLMAGVPQLLLRYTDTAVHVGPIVEPPGAPCHACVTLDFVAQDPAYPVLAAQLTHVTPRSEAPGITGVAIGFAGAMIREWLSGDVSAEKRRIVIPTEHGGVSAPPYFEWVSPHADCACQLA